jgi:hypothetical protein
LFLITYKTPSWLHAKTISSTIIDKTIGSKLRGHIILKSSTTNQKGELRIEHLSFHSISPTTMDSSPCTKVVDKLSYNWKIITMVPKNRDSNNHLQEHIPHIQLGIGVDLNNYV